MPSHARPRAAGASSGGVGTVREPGDPRVSRRAIAQWRAVAQCIAAAYADYERGLVALRRESVRRLTASLARQGLTPENRAAHGHGTGRHRPAAGRKNRR